MWDAHWVTGELYVMICSVPEEVQTFSRPQVALWQKQREETQQNSTEPNTICTQLDLQGEVLELNVASALEMLPQSEHCEQVNIVLKMWLQMYKFDNCCGNNEGKLINWMKYL